MVLQKTFGNKYNKWTPTKSQLEDIIWLYKTKSMSYIAKQYNKDISSIRRILVENNIPIKGLSEVHKLPVDDTFFSIINTEEKAYWLGFIYADGYITKCNGRPVLGVRLHIDDKDHLAKFKKSIHSKHKIIEEIIKSSYGITRACSINIVNETLVCDLLDKGVFYNKSKILKPPPSNKLPDALVRHFLRGYLDGDGSIYQCKAKKEGWKPSGNFSFIGTYEFLNWVLTKIKDICSTNTKMYKYEDKDIWEIKVGGNKNFLTLYNYFYKDATIYLSRKRNKAEIIKANI